MRAHGIEWSDALRFVTSVKHSNADSNVEDGPVTAGKRSSDTDGLPERVTTAIGVHSSAEEILQKTGHAVGGRVASGEHLKEEGPNTVPAEKVYCVSVLSTADCSKGEILARIPKSACLTPRTTEASDLLEAFGLCGNLALVAAIMFEKSLGPKSKWFEYLQQIPDQEDLPFVWGKKCVDELLSGTEIYEVRRNHDSGVSF